MRCRAPLWLAALVLVTPAAGAGERIDLFHTATAPVHVTDATRARLAAEGIALGEHALDGQQQLEAELSAGLPADPAAAEVVARTRLEALDPDIVRARIEPAAQGAVLARALQLTKLPAIVIGTGQPAPRIVYGLADLDAALALDGSSAPDTGDPAPLVLHDAGGVPIAPYLDALLADADDPDTAAPEEPHPMRPQPQYPIHSPRLQPGDWSGPATPAVQARLAYFRTPVAVLGTDARSRDWLSAHATRLQQLDVVLLVIESPSAAATAALHALVPGLRLALASGDALAETLGLTVYPVLVSARGIEQ